MIYQRRQFLGALWALPLAGCLQDDPRTAYQPTYSDQPSVRPGPHEFVFGIHPLHNPAMLFDIYGPLVDWLNVRLGEGRIVLEASRNYEEYDRKLAARHFDLSMPNPYQTLLGLQAGYRVFAKMGNDEVFRGLILTRADSPVSQVRDLLGKVVSFPAKTALAATMMPQRYLHDHGLPLKSYQQRYVGSQESSIMNAYLGDSMACATWPPPWETFQREYPERAEEMRVLWVTDSLPSVSLMARNDFPPALLDTLRSALLHLHEDERGRELLARIPLKRFEAASEITYQPVRRFVDDFERQVRPLKGQA